MQSDFMDTPTFVTFGSSSTFFRLGATSSEILEPEYKATWKRAMRSSEAIWMSETLCLGDAER